MKHYQVIEMSGRKARIEPIGTFPRKCPKCGATWHIRESWVYNGLYDTGGKTACCDYCDSRAYEVRDVWIGTTSR